MDLESGIHEITFKNRKGHHTMQLDTDKLKRQMAIKFMSGANLAEATGLSRQSIYRILRGANQPKPANFRAICEALDCDPRDLLRE